MYTHTGIGISISRGERFTQNRKMIEKYQHKYYSVINWLSVLKTLRQAVAFVGRKSTDSPIAGRTCVESITGYQ